MRHRVRPRIHIERLEDRSLPSFVAPSSSVVGVNGGGHSHPVAVVTGDFNRDGILDVVTANRGGPFANSGTDGISVLLGTGNGSFKPARNMNFGHRPEGILAVDVNGDGKLDLATANKDDNTVTILIGSGAGSFAVAGTFAGGSKPVEVAAGDVNGDTHIDLAVADNGASTVTILLGDGKGAFTAGGTVAVGTNPTSVVVADFNNDQHPDIASVSGGFGHLDINLNNDDGTFAGPVNYATGFVANTVVVGYFNNDQQPDLAVACNFPSGDGVSILLGNADGTFQPFAKYDAGGQTPKTIAVGDFNRDGKQDLITANDQFANNSVSVLTGNGDGTFGAARVFVAGQGPQDVAVGDFNRDGRLDAITCDTGSSGGFGVGEIGTVTLLLGNGDGTLVASPDLTVSQPGPIIATDLTGDNIPDLAVVTNSVQYNGVTIFPGLGDGEFGTRLLTPVINQPTSIEFGDFNGDNKKDLAVGTASGVTVLINNGDGSFGTRNDYTVAGNPTWVAVSDFNGDQKLDLAVTDDGGVSILLGNGDGTFGLPTTIGAGGKGSYVTTADFNGDSKRDLAVVNGADNTVSILFGNGNGTFALSTPSYSTLVGPGSVSAGDFNGDGKPDLAIPTFFGHAADSNVAILLNGAGGKFKPAADYGTGSRPIGSLALDFNGDGKLDLAIVNNFADDVYIFNGSGTGTFGTPTRYIVGDRPTWLATADFNGDGKRDLAVVNSNSGTVTLLETPAPATQFRVNVPADNTTAGKAVKAMVSALDAAGHLVTGYTGAVSLTTTDLKARPPAAHTFTAADGGNFAFTVNLRTAGNQDIVAHAPIGTGAGSVQVVADKAVRLSVLALTNPTAGTPFDLTISAVDRFGNPDPTFTGTVHVTATDKAPGISLPRDYTFVADDKGVHPFAGGGTLLTAGRRVISATTVGAKIAGSLRVTVSAGALAKFAISGLPTTLAANSTHSFTVTAQDASGNIITNYAGTVQFANAAGSALLPAAYTFLPTDKGKHVFKVVFQTPGADQSLTVMDAADNNIAGSMTGITVT